jgi:peroxiredoxin
MRKSSRFSLFFIVGVLLFTLLETAPSRAATKMPEFKLEDVATGKTINSSSFDGKSLLVVFFATWCPPCVQEIPHLIQLHRDYKSNGFSVVAISVDQEKGVVQKMVDRKEINYPVMMADSSVTRDFGGVYGIPTSFLVSSSGTVLKKYSGYVPQSVLVKDIEQIIN